MLIFQSISMILCLELKKLFLKIGLVLLKRKNYFNDFGNRGGENPDKALESGTKILKLNTKNIQID